MNCSGPSVTSAQIDTPQMSASALCTTLSPKTEQVLVCDTQAESYDLHILWKQVSNYGSHPTSVCYLLPIA